MKITEVIEKIVAYHPPLNENETRDVFKCGDPGAECTGVAVTCFASVKVIEQCVEKGINLIICHEPAFYSDKDDGSWLTGNRIYEQKRRLIDEHGIVIWRDHDHIHAGPESFGRASTDMIFYGIMKTLGWEKYLIGDIKKPLLYCLPETTAGELAMELSGKLGLNGARLIGDPDAKVQKVFIAEHINGREADKEKIMRADSEDYDVLIPLETVDWTILEYVTDSSQLGRSRAVISLGHFNFEEAGMKYMADWLPELLGGAVNVEFIQSGDIYSYITR